MMENSLLKFDKNDFTINNLKTLNNALKGADSEEELFIKKLMIELLDKLKAEISE